MNSHYLYFSRVLFDLLFAFDDHARMTKRRFNPAEAEDRTPIVEKLYKAAQPSFAGAGGFCDSDDEQEEKREQFAEARQKRRDAAAGSTVAPDDCSLCHKPLLDSWLWEKFSHPVCENCRDRDGEHKLVARTEVKNEYLLKDCDLDLRKPPLRFWSKKNPHNPRYGDMKLYLKCQVVERMLEVHGSWEGLALAKEERTGQRETRRQRTFEKKVKEMRQHIRAATTSSRRLLDPSHTHEYGPEEHIKDDEYKQVCTSCGHENKYEKM